MSLTLNDLRRFAVARSLFPAVTGRAPRDAGFTPALEEELEAMRHFPGITPHASESTG